MIHKPHLNLLLASLNFLIVSLQRKFKENQAPSQASTYCFVQKQSLNPLKAILVIMARLPVQVPSAGVPSNARLQPALGFKVAVEVLLNARTLILREVALHGLRLLGVAQRVGIKAEAVMQATVVAVVASIMIPVRRQQGWQWVAAAQAVVLIAARP